MLTRLLIKAVYYKSSRNFSCIYYIILKNCYGKIITPEIIYRSVYISIKKNTF